MPRRRLSERQVQRIQAIQERRRQRLEQRTERVLEQLDDNEPRHGQVIVRHGANLAVADDHGGVKRCLARRNIGHPVCGDRVVWQPTGPDCGVVTALLPRTTVLSRPGYDGRDKPLAANISLIVVVIATRPEPSSYLIDQYLVTAELIGVETIILVNKMDLLEETERAGFLSRLSHYQRIGYPLLALSVREMPALEPLMPRLAGQTSILLGQSGVGKSSLVNTLLPSQEVQVGRLSAATGLGRHTTSAATCYTLENGGRLIDSPGVRSFRLGEIAVADLERGFREFAPYLQHCRFNNCRHLHEPECAVRAAVEAGKIARCRLENFHHLGAQAQT
jgi:ribosome biogenesis GTPase